MIVVTAPTGHIGSQVLANLPRYDEAVRVVVRDPDRLPAEVRDRVEVVVGSHRDRAVVDHAFDGADSVFWLVPADKTAATEPWRIQQQIANKRNDFCHKLTTALVKNHDAVCLEDLNVTGLAKTKLAKSILDASIGTIRRQVQYKGA